MKRTTNKTPTTHKIKHEIKTRLASQADVTNGRTHYNNTTKHAIIKTVTYQANERKHDTSENKQYKRNNKNYNTAD